jgi:hypothetical protein
METLRRHWGQLTAHRTHCPLIQKLDIRGIQLQISISSILTLQSGSLLLACFLLSNA